MAATTPKYLLNGTINYVAKLAYGAGYDKTAKYNSISNMGDYLAIELYSNSYSGSATAEEGIWFNFSYVKIIANVKQSKSPHNQNCSFGHTSFELKNIDTGTIIKSGSLSGTGERTLIAQSLSDGHYMLTYVAGGAITGVTSGSITDTFTFDFYLDATAPTISGASTSTTGKYTNSAFTVSASDSCSGVQNLYMKAPGGYELLGGRYFEDGCGGKYKRFV